MLGQFAVPFCLNQGGSVLYYVLLGQERLSLAVPICNASSLVFTTLTATLVRGERLHNPWLAACGIALITLGVTLIMSTSL